jgi:FkbM family methyltransferase
LAVQRPDLHIVAIEPVPDNVACLRENVKVNGLTNIEIVPAAVSARAGSVEVVVAGPWSYIVETGGVGVPAITLDMFADRNVSLIKIDVEGWEPYVIAGCPALLSKAMPLVYMEWNTLALMTLHHDPLSFADALWGAFDILDCFAGDKSQGVPQSAKHIVIDNVVRDQSVSDVLMRPRAGCDIPSLRTMIDPPRFW